MRVSRNWNAPLPLILTIPVALLPLAGCRHGAQHPGHRPPATVDLLVKAEHRGVIAPVPDRRAFVAYNIGGIIKRGLAFKPPGTATLPAVEIVPGARLDLEFATPPPTWFTKGGGVIFRVRVARVPASPRREAAVVFERHLNPSISWRERRWNFGSFVFPPEMRGRAQIILEAEPESPEERQPPWAVWSDVLLLTLPPVKRASAPNLVLVTLDTTRADHLSPYGYEKPTTPFLERLARVSLLFERAYTTSTWTLPAHESLFTGQYPIQHYAATVRRSPRPRGCSADSIEMVGNNTERVLEDAGPLDKSALTLAEVLQAEGYMTMGIAGGPFLTRKYGIDQGFSYYSDLWRGHKRLAENANRVARGWLKRLDRRPFFLFVNYFDPHTPYDPPNYDADDRAILAAHGIDARSFSADGLEGQRLPADLVQALVDRYDAEIAYTDRALAHLVGLLQHHGLWENTVLCVVADHGESFGEHLLWGHGNQFYEDQARVPLILRSPGSHGPGRRVTTPISLRQVPALLLDELGIKAPHTFAPKPSTGLGRSSGPLYGERYLRSGSMRMVLDYPYKYLVNLRVDTSMVGRDEFLFDVSKDAGENSNLILQDGPAAARVRGLYQEIVKKLGAVEALKAPHEVPGPPRNEEELDLRERLRALGYVQ